jgi:hypothetical protein
MLAAAVQTAQAEYTYNSQGKRNPFIALVTPDGRLLKLEDEAPKNVTLTIEGIIYDKNGNSYALVSGEVLKVGDEINTFQVLKIEKTKVVLIKDGQTSEIELKKEE